MKIIVTAREIFDFGVWDKFCNERGINEGLMESSEKFELSAEEAEKYGFMARKPKPMSANDIENDTLLGCEEGRKELVARIISYHSTNKRKDGEHTEDYYARIKAEGFDWV